MPAICFDTETTGLEPGSRLLELAAVLIDDEGRVISEFDELVDPGRPIPPDVVAVHGIDDATVAGASDAAGVLQRFLAWCPKDTPWVAHNAPFDIGILGFECSYHGLAWPAPRVIDSRHLAAKLAETPDNKLQTLVTHHGWERVGPAHRALPDAHHVARLFHHARCHELPGRCFKGKVPKPKWTWPGKDLPAHLLALGQALTGGARVELGYVNADGWASRRSLTPWGLAAGPDGIRFHGLCSLAGERRSFRGDRVTACSLTGDQERVSCKTL